MKESIPPASPDRKLWLMQEAPVCGCRVGRTRTVSYTHLDVYKRQTLNLFIGTAINPAHQNPGLPSDLSIKLKLIDKLCGLMERLGKRVTKKYY